MIPRIYTSAIIVFMLSALIDHIFCTSFDIPVSYARFVHRIAYELVKATKVRFRAKTRKITQIVNHIDSSSLAWQGQSFGST